MTGSVEAPVLESVRASGLLGAGMPVVVLLSGGADSACLLDVAARIAGADAVTALHVDHGLRAGSAADAEHCRALCGGVGVRAEVVAVARPPGGGNVQAWARGARYDAAAAAAGPRDADVATGHTASDQVETVLYRLAASPGRRTLLGMAPRQGRIVRPLLGITRSQAAAYCSARGLPVLDDPSNADRTFARARVRHDLVPALRSLHPAAEANVLRTVALLRDEAAVLDAVVDAALDGRGEIAMDRLAALPRPLARLVLRRLAEAATGSLAGRVPDRLDDVLALASHDGPAALDLGDGARATVRRGVLRLVVTPPLA